MTITNQLLFSEFNLIIFFRFEHDKLVGLLKAGWMLNKQVLLFTVCLHRNLLCVREKPTTRPFSIPRNEVLYIGLY